MDKHLHGMWLDINEHYFDNQLIPLADIDYGELSGPDGIGAHGIYIGNGNCIIIDQLFKFDEEAVRKDVELEKNKLEIVYRLVLHEMLHQAVHQNAGRIIGGHGQEFLEEARRVAKLLAQPEPTEENVARWPLNFLIDMIADERNP